MNTNSEFVRNFFNNNYFADEQTLRRILETVGTTAAAACLTAVLSDVILRSLVSVRPTRINVENGVPAELYAIGKNDYPTDVYVSTKRSQADLRPALFFAAVFVGCKLILENREKNIANVKR
ncbi:MAG: hypothetical protein J6I96_01465 [Oscillospiraceae bacterium]|nr:hypothetical protein [Oscillospiraceae bacterium]